MVCEPDLITIWEAMYIMEHCNQVRIIYNTNKLLFKIEISAMISIFIPQPYNSKHVVLTSNLAILPLLFTICHSPAFMLILVGYTMQKRGLLKKFNGSAKKMDFLFRTSLLVVLTFKKSMLFWPILFRYRGCHRHTMLFWPKIKPLDFGLK